MIILTFLTGCISSTTPHTPAENEYEAELQQVVLPGPVKFTGKNVDPVAFFSWVAEEAQKHDRRKTKVSFDIRISADHRPSPDSDLQRSFTYDLQHNVNTITLPDALKYYTAVMGLGLRFERNKAVIYTIE